MRCYQTFIAHRGPNYLLHGDTFTFYCKNHPTSVDDLEGLYLHTEGYDLESPHTRPQRARGFAFLRKKAATSPEGLIRIDRAHTMVLVGKKLTIGWGDSAQTFMGPQVISFIRSEGHET